MAKKNDYSWIWVLVLILFVGAGLLFNAKGCTWGGANIVNKYYNYDSDGDGYSDDLEVDEGTDPEDADDVPDEADVPPDCDPDDDGESDCPEDPPPDPEVSDSDGDGYSDGEEADWGSNPYDPSDFPVDPVIDDDGDVSGFNCGQDNECFGGTCPSSYECGSVHFAVDDYYACVCTSGSVLHPEWKPEGSMHIPIGGVI